MNELIAIPVESDRRAVAVLAALRQLEAEYAGQAAAAGPPAAAAAPTARRRLVRLRLACAAFAVAARVDAVRALGAEPWLDLRRDPTSPPPAPPAGGPPAALDGRPPRS